MIRVLHDTSAKNAKHDIYGLRKKKSREHVLKTPQNEKIQGNVHIADMQRLLTVNERGSVVRAKRSLVFENTV